MYCNECKVKIEGKTSVCPLCGVKIENSQENLAFPIPAPKTRVKNNFVRIYAIVFFAVIIPSLFLNYKFNNNIMWSYMLLAAMVYVFVLIRYTITAQSHFRQRLIGQTVILTFVFFVVQRATNNFLWILSIWLPALYITSDILMVSHLIRYKKYARKNMISIYILSFLGLIPTITAYIMNLTMKIPSIVASALGVIIAAVLSIIFRKNIISEIKKFFHI